MSAILGENWSRGSVFMLQFMGAVCIVCMLSLFSNTHGLIWIATDHSPIDPRYPGANWGIAQSQVIHHQTGPKYDPAGDNYAGTTMWENHFSMQHKKIQQKMGRFIFLPTKKKDWIIPKKNKKTKTPGTMDHPRAAAFLMTFLRICGSPLGAMVHRSWTYWQLLNLGELSTIHQQFTNQHRKKHRCHFELPVASTKLHLTSRFLTNISCPCYKFTNPEMWNVSQSSFKHWSERTTKNDRPWGGA